MSKDKKSSSFTIHEVHKNELDIRRFKLNKVNFEVTCESHPNHLKTYFMKILRGFFDHHI